MPGETAYVVLDENGKPLEADQTLPDASEVLKKEPTAWYADAWDSVQLAGNPPREKAPATTFIDRPGVRGLPGGAGPVIDPADESAIAAQLGREPRAIHEVGHRCPCGNPDVVTTEPRLPNGTPFPTTFYLTCPRAASRIGTLEGVRADEGDAGPARRGPRAGGGLPRGARALPRRAARELGDRCPRSRASPPAGCPTG